MSKGAVHDIFYGSTPLLKESDISSNSTFCGRKVSLCDCTSIKTVYTTAAVAGLVLLVIGIVALIGHLAPTTAGGTGSPILQKLNAAVTFVSNQLGTDPLILVTFPTAFGFGLGITGIVGIVQITQPDQ